MSNIETTPGESKPIPWKVYLAHALSTWGDNMWWFAGGLYMIQLAPGSLRLTATYGLVIAASVICFGATVGNWIDKTKRITAAQTFLAIQNLCVSICALLVSFYLWTYPSKSDDDSMVKDDKLELENDTNNMENITDHLPGFVPAVPSLPHPETAKLVTIVGMIFFSSIARLASSGTVIILQKDWIVVIADNDTDYLATMNSILRTIELTTYMLAPTLSGQLFTFIGYIWTGIFIAVWNLVSVCCEYYLLNGIYRQYPQLAQKIVEGLKKEDEEENGGESRCLTEEYGEEKPGKLLDDPKNTDISCAKKVIPHILLETFKGWKMYFHHPVRNAGLGLALLYMTVLGFDNITYGYVIIQRVPEAVLGGVVAVSALVGVLGSTTYPILKRYLGLERTGLLGMFMLVSTSTLCVASIFVPGSPFLNKVYQTEEMKQEHIDNNVTKPTMEQAEVLITPYSLTHITMLIAGIIIARFGLWIVDLTITQILQERVEEERRGVINGVQDSLNNTMDLLKCILVILLPSAENFGYLILLSYFSISSGWIFYALFSRQQRGHLFHFCRLNPCVTAHNDLERNSHWPFFPEQGSAAKDCDEEHETSIYASKNGDENEVVNKQTLEARKLENIIGNDAAIC